MANEINNKSKAIAHAVSTEVSKRRELAKDPSKRMTSKEHSVIAKIQNGHNGRGRSLDN